MSKNAVNRAFEPFSRVEKDTKYHATSNGVGLSICKSICLQLGGDIEVASTLGVGTTFKFSVKARPFEKTKLQSFKQKLVNNISNEKLDII